MSAKHAMTHAETIITEYLASETLMRGLIIRLKAEGLMIVPRVATEAMIRSGVNATAIEADSDQERRLIWNAMAEAASGSGHEK